MELSWDALRAGQKSAVQIIEQRVRRSESTTAIVLPCRYGKSDVARVSSLKLWDEGGCSGALALSPNTVLREQLASTDKWSAALSRYKVSVSRDPLIAELKQVKVKPAPNGEMFLSATTQMVSNNKQIFAKWIESQVHRTGLPVVIFVDECHTGSEDNTWGDIVPTFINAGAHVVLLTATAERADGKQIPGFRFESADEDEVKVYRCAPGSTPEMVKVDVLSGTKTRLRLVPDLEVSFGEAWAVEALCKVSRNPFDVDLRTVKGLNEEHQWLSQMSPSRSREVLGRLVRQPMAITEGCKRLVESLRARRHHQPDCQAIVYCGNDIESSTSNGHPKEIKQALKKIDKSLNVLIATAADGADDGTLRRFVGSDDVPGEGDILIVKQMAGVGLDVPRLKIGLDLSPTRTYASFVQRMMRPATPHGRAMAMEWISPDDVSSAALFEKLVTNQGGEATASDLAVVDSYEKEREEGPESLALFPEGVSPGDFDDSGGNRADRERWSAVDQIVKAFPELLLTNSQAEIASRVELAGIAFTPAPDEETVSVHDTSTEADAIRAELNSLAKTITNDYIQRGGDYSRYPVVIERVWAAAKKRSNWPVGVKLVDTDDLDLLKRMRHVLESDVTDLQDGR